MWDYHSSRGMPIEVGNKLLKLMGMRWEWERLLLIFPHLVIILPSKSMSGLLYL